MTIQRSAIPAYAKTLPLDRLMAPEIDPSCHYLGHGDDTVAFILTLDSINFGSGYFPHLRKRPGMSGYFTVASSLTDHFRKRGPVPTEELIRISASDCGRIFNQDEAGPAGELMSLFARALNDLGSHVGERFSGNFAGLVESAGRSAARLIEELSGMPFFRDVQEYQALKVPFYKRAQLTAGDLSLAFNGKGPGEFHDIDRLTVFADNLVPHVLRVDGLLVYDEQLASRIDSGELIVAGSDEEIEIRACALHAVEMIADELRRSGLNATASRLDYLLWNRGQQPFYKQAKPRHRTRTVFY
ncbi:MAG TPA: queuosine salvage family protein [Blastocatellia bacterium]|nr:queuosine salvage family protein [Blastocatellia bacterium]